MFLVCESKNNKTLVSKETSKSLSTFYAEYNLISKTVNVTFNSILLIFSAQISNPLGLNLNLLFNIKRYSATSSSQDIGSTYIFSSRTKNNSKTFSFQFLDENLTPGIYTYSISVSSNTFSHISPGLIIPICNLDFINGN